MIRLCRRRKLLFRLIPNFTKKVIVGCIKIVEKEKIKQRQGYSKIVKQLVIDQRFWEHSKRKKKANAAARKQKPIVVDRYGKLSANLMT